VSPVRENDTTAPDAALETEVHMTEEPMGLGRCRKYRVEPSGSDTRAVTVAEVWVALPTLSEDTTGSRFWVVKVLMVVILGGKVLSKDACTV